MNSVTVLLPARARFGGQRFGEAFGRRLGRADRSVEAADQAARAFDILPRGWPVAAVTRQRDAGDAAHAAWLRADPAYVRPDINGARLLAYGQALALSERDSAALLPALRPLFGDAGFPIDAPSPSRWYLCLPREARLPRFASPEQALGEDLFQHLPEGDGAEGRRWRSLLSEAQVVLHNHPHNVQRIAAGLAPINSLWFWGAGVLPDHVRSDYAEVFSDDEALTAFGALAGVRAEALPPRWSGGEGAGLFDLRAMRDLALVQRDWLEPIGQALDAGAIDRAVLGFADGERFELARSQRWRFWRKPLRALLDAEPAQ
ncbi:phosphoglycerate mutase [Lysobacter firmicutimachus]|uniref:Phosphoglycerate mutase n=1 Tax=Lysobacter firmicutimachus TaxID=1792846 RepID=A0AAU8MP99_9GAMM